MKVCVVGAGSIGGYVGVRLALAGEDVTFVARGKNLEAIRAKGMRLTMADGTDHIAPGIRATASFAEARPQDLVILGMKAHQVEPVAQELRHLLRDDTIIVLTGTPTPHIEAVFALVKLLGRTMQEEKVYIRAHPFLG